MKTGRWPDPPPVTMPSPQRPGMLRPSLAGWVRQLERHEASALLRAERARALRDPALFLHETAAEELQDRLAMVNRDFTKPAIVTGFPDFWSSVLPGATVVPRRKPFRVNPSPCPSDARISSAT